MNKKWKISINAPVTIGFGVICVLALIVNTLTGGVSNYLFFMNYRASLKDPLTYLRFFSHVLGHGSVEHLIGNMSYILLLGPLLEEKYGSEVLIKTILITAFSTGLVNFIFFPNAALLGASGVVFAFIILSSITDLKAGEIPLTFILVAVIYIGQQIYQGIYVEDNVANFAHIIGGIVGATVGFKLKK